MGDKEVIMVGKRVPRHFDGFCTAQCHSQSNVKAERIHVKIQEIKTIGGGYRTFENFQ